VKTGRPRKPTALKLLEGETRPSRIGRREPKPPPIRPECPAFLNAAARRLWRAFAPQLENLGVLTLVDESVLAEFCAAYEEAQRLTRYLDKAGLTFTIETTGYVGQRPEVAIRNKAWDRVRRAGAELGIGAASRGRLDMPQGQGGPLADIGAEGAWAEPRTLDEAVAAAGRVNPGDPVAKAIAAAAWRAPESKPRP